MSRLKVTVLGAGGAGGNHTTYVAGGSGGCSSIAFAAGGPGDDPGDWATVDRWMDDIRHYADEVNKVAGRYTNCCQCGAPRLAPRCDYCLSTS